MVITMDGAWRLCSSESTTIPCPRSGLKFRDPSALKTIETRRVGASADCMKGDEHRYHSGQGTFIGQFFYRKLSPLTEDGETQQAPESMESR